MPLYAYDELGSPIFANDAKEKNSYKCYSCHRVVRVRKGLRTVPHFYHLRLSPSCRLYGKSQDHMFAQLAIEKILPIGETVLERRFPEINRVGDVAWEPKKIIFEIQCSHIQRHETEQRVSDYLKVGYQIVWILDDRIFNRRTYTSAEKWMREMACYFATIRGHARPIFYDQFEILSQKRRVRRGGRLKIEIGKPCYMPEISWDSDAMPSQVLHKGKPKYLYFFGDLVHKALLSHESPTLNVSMQQMQALERAFSVTSKKERWFQQNFVFFLRECLGRFLYFLLKLNDAYEKNIH